MAPPQAWGGKSVLGWFVGILGLSLLTGLGATKPGAKTTKPAAAPTAQASPTAATNALANAADPNTPPKLKREFRGLWIASVGNIDWPSKPGLPASEQRAELQRMLDRAAALQLNAVLLQVRPSCDALYASKLEPWSEYLSGTMGIPPSPAYDPLEFAVAEAHARGLELHAWFNPFRARYTQAKSPIPESHVSRAHKNWTRTYGNLQWLDPGLVEVQNHSLAVIKDVVERYDIDGIHLDDYFYPYPDATLPNPEFPDQKTYDAYVTAGGTLAKPDWRRANVNAFVESLYKTVRASKPWVKVGISPFGIWRPDHPPGIRGLDAFTVLSADARLWLQKGWVDYLAPQLYWPVDRREQSFPVLLNWWQAQNTAHRHLWPGMATANLMSPTPGKAWKLDEVVRQIRIAREQDGCEGHLHWGANVLLGTSNRFDEALRTRAYPAPALVPTFPWLDKRSPEPPVLSVKVAKDRWNASWTESDKGAPVSTWIVQLKTHEGWSTRIQGAANNRLNVVFAKGKPKPDALWITPVSRTGALGTPVSYPLPKSEPATSAAKANTN